MRALLLLSALLIAGCSGGSPPVAAPKPAPAAPPAPRWQAVPAKADGRPVPGGRAHVVKPGETGLAIATAYRVPWRTIAAANGIGFDSVIRVGQTIFVPLGPPPAPKPKPAAPVAKASPDPEALARDFTLDIEELVSASTVATAATTAPASSASPPAAPTVPRLAWPVDGRVILSGFGPKPGGLVNEGINIRAVRGGPVRAAAPGTILYVGDAIPRFGLLVLVRHAGGAVTAYGHLEDALVAKGAAVERGAIIARAGATGSAKEPQLLFQLRLGRKAVDPLPYLKA